MKRTSKLTRATKETEISLGLCLDGGEISVSTGIGFFDHMLTALAFYAGFGMELTVRGDLNVDGHHTVEDAGIVLGRCLKEALGDKAGIRRFASSYVPMDEALCRTVLDFSGRPFLVFDAPMPQERIGEYESCLTVEFMRALAFGAELTLHQTALYGGNAHHVTEALFKSLGLCLKEALRVEGGGITSTKGVL
ncbi:imidazoleglycerol-phosphate dehydratase HisB [Papillibacter cinnamivorans]|uniref:Imidazoleglycerol-phosphate dehydratase n=1 Tax=Papillibacter cinnamivorans DSM 12816 TaxID=1122930 RepID=A0A1W1YLS4_9FIRM|nr:imidazoleglycerol-phosphate dehydratase HisB [Papillibacter cinnamivorans]SMC37127.1 imidazoleglycerol-phosphate dehydratase [Papillibacter cinnamivorans DSM 12816]